MCKKTRNQCFKLLTYSLGNSGNESRTFNMFLIHFVEIDVDHSFLRVNKCLSRLQIISLTIDSNCIKERL